MCVNHCNRNCYEYFHLLHCAFLKLWNETHSDQGKYLTATYFLSRGFLRACCSMNHHICSFWESQEDLVLFIAFLLPFDWPKMTCDYRHGKAPHGFSNTKLCPGSGEWCHPWNAWRRTRPTAPERSGNDSYRWCRQHHKHNFMWFLKLSFEAKLKNNFSL